MSQESLRDIAAELGGLKMNVFGEYVDPELVEYKPPPVKTYVITDEMRRADARSRSQREQASRSAWGLRPHLSVANLEGTRCKVEGRKDRLQVAARPGAIRHTDSTAMHGGAVIHVADPGPVVIVTPAEEAAAPVGVQPDDLAGSDDGAAMRTAGHQRSPDGGDVITSFAGHPASLGEDSVDAPPSQPVTGVERLACTTGCGRRVKWHNPSGMCRWCTNSLRKQMADALTKPHVTILTAGSAEEHEVDQVWASLTYEDRWAALEACLRGA